tara:strand:+ start:256 stop:732 length:477 start_codon:yes stop_codon:yes gene_type:complete
MKYVGIKNSRFKSQIVKRSSDIGRVVSLKLPCLTADDCNRHFDILRLFDSENNDFKKTEYYMFNKNNGKSNRSILKKIEKFRKLYESIKKRGFLYGKGYIILSEDGARLDGSHRASIVEHLKMNTLDVIMVKWEDLFKSNDLNSLFDHILSQKEKYNA